MQIIIQILQSLPVSSFSIQIFALPLSECLFEKKYSYHSCRGSIYSRKFQDKSAFPFPVSVSHFATETLELLTVWHCTNHQYCKESYLGRRSWGNFSCTKPTRRPSVTMWSSALPQHNPLTCQHSVAEQDHLRSSNSREMSLFLILLFWRWHCSPLFLKTSITLIQLSHPFAGKPNCFWRNQIFFGTNMHSNINRRKKYS